MTGTEEKAKVAANQDVPRWAADEPTAMWSDDDLREHGFDASASSESSAGSGNVASGASRSTGGAPQKLGRGPQGGGGAVADRGGLSWTATLVIAALVAVVVYLVVRSLR